MILYQLPNGKTVYLTLEEYLSLTEEDIRLLNSYDEGAAPRDPFYGSSINNRRKKNSPEDSHDKSIDFKDEDDDLGNDQASTDTEGDLY